MKKYSLMLVMLLAGCSTIDKAVDSYLMKFDANEYKLITDLRTNASLAKLDCADTQKTKKNVDRIWVSALTLKNYAENLPHNGPIQKASVEMYDIVDGIQKHYQVNDKVSEVYCKVKMSSIENNANTMQQIEGSKPK
jgi:hypothetical protein